MILLLNAALAIVLALASASETPEWWRSAAIYEVCPPSFQDSDGDGIGDLKGIMSRMDYFLYVGVEAIWLTPVYTSPMVDFGYDIANFTDIDKIFGTMNDFDELVTAMHKSGIRVMMDFVPNHTSDQHLWFECSKNTSHPLHQDYRDFYVWVPPNGTIDGVPQLPNNWISVYRGSAWTYNEDRKQFYLHQFSAQQPDLNFRNPAVVGNMTDVIKFWMDKNIDGLRVDAGAHLFENIDLLSEPQIPGTTGEDYGDFEHIHTKDQPENPDLLKRWAAVVNERNQQDKRDRCMILELYDDIETLIPYFGGPNLSLLVPLNLNLIVGTNSSSTSCVYKDIIDSWKDNLPEGGVLSWVSGNHDQLRVATRLGTEMVDAMNMIILFLPGFAVTYYGEEIGMEDTLLRSDQIKDPSAFRGGKDRDPFRTPMQWDDSTNAGFTCNRKAWLPVNPNFWRLNVAKQKCDETSHLNIYKAIIKARKTSTLKLGGLTVLTPNNYTLVITRDFNLCYSVLVVNLGSEEQTYSPQSLLSGSSCSLDNSSSWSVLIGSGNSGYQSGAELERSLEVITLRPKAAIILGNCPIHDQTCNSTMYY